MSEGAVEQGLAAVEGAWCWGILSCRPGWSEALVKVGPSQLKPSVLRTVAGEQQPMLRPRGARVEESELVAHVRLWLALLAEGRLDQACAELDEPNAYGIRWSPASILEALAQAFSEGSRFRREHPEGPHVSPVEAASGDGAASVIAFADGSGFSVEHRVPLNGSYSDLTAQTEFRWRGPELAFVLQDLHVL